MTDPNKKAPGATNTEGHKNNLHPHLNATEDDLSTNLYEAGAASNGSIA